MRLVRPTLEHLPGYTAALQAGWSADTERGADAAREELAAIERAPAVFVNLLEDRQGRGAPVTLPDGSQVARLPGFRLWIWDDEGFAGVIGLRWQRGTPELPPYCLGHIGYSVVPWKRRRGHATAALRQMLPEARAVGLPWVDITTDPDNLASQRVILANGGELVERFTKPQQFGSTPGLRWRISLALA
ncbi:GNAT family N-acetyltransferase [Rubrivivax gelatinosus]|jgi:predicted acetyltransferase|uniref:Putative acetyltransferase n=1 Tax=Rubrivivax gelatinosus TaxID=28068 RepID=A0A4R2MBX2_RUBGE|nr:GNAT family N-acetyltransferase [Rubrivivax gelatinosus]MBK1689221.1 GNAT family N-acetyltransferase [Rubrivivax gelatinosus]TCP02057.1 putative acetyltransferase [Rubrivivax gelatinosus]